MVSAQLSKAKKFLMALTQVLNSRHSFPKSIAVHFSLIIKRSCNTHLVKNRSLTEIDTRAGLVIALPDTRLGGQVQVAYK